MLLQFKVVADDSLWSLDTDRLRYARLTRPLTELAENPTDEPAIEEFGKLVQMDPVCEVYRMEGRTPHTDGPGGGLTTVVLVVRITGTTLEIVCSANVPVTDVINVKPINDVRCVVAGQKELVQ